MIWLPQQPFNRPGERCAGLGCALDALAPRCQATRLPLRRRAHARRLRAVGLLVTHAARARVACACIRLSPFSRDAGSVVMADCRRPSRCFARPL